MKNMFIAALILLCRLQWRYIIQHHPERGSPSSDSFTKIFPLWYSSQSATSDRPSQPRSLVDQDKRFWTVISGHLFSIKYPKHLSLFGNGTKPFLLPPMASPHFQQVLDHPISGSSRQCHPMLGKSNRSALYGNPLSITYLTSADNLAQICLPEVVAEPIFEKRRAIISSDASVDFGQW